MEIGNASGTPQEIHDFFKITGQDISKFIDSDAEVVHKIWIIVPAGLFFALCMASLFTAKNANTFLDYAILASSLVSVWLAVALHAKYKSWTLSILCWILAVLMILVSAQITQLGAVAALLKAITDACT